MLTIGITTFKHRFEKYFKPLINQIKMFHPDIEIIVAINGEHKEEFDENYRTEILDLVSKCKNTFPIMYPQFRGLSKLWNNIMIHASNEHVLMLNDDVSITSPILIEKVIELIKENDYRCFKINGSWSHVVLNKSQVQQLNYFDERLLGIGEEDGAFEWKYNNTYVNKFENIYINGIINHVDMSHTPTNTTAIKQGKYSQFNQNVMYTEIFNIDRENGKQMGICPEPLIQIVSGYHSQYPYEPYYQERKDEL